MSAPITVYSKPSCVQCAATQRALAKSGLTYEVVDLADNETALQEVLSMGYQQAPVVVAGDTSWSGFRPDLIKAAADRAHAA